MGIVIDHEARRRAIIAKSIQLFAEQGYDGVTYQKIADSCSIARTTLYKYFHNKREIFNYAIWDVANLLIGCYKEILTSKDNVIVRLERILDAVLRLLFEQNGLVVVLNGALILGHRCIGKAAI